MMRYILDQILQKRTVTIMKDKKLSLKKENEFLREFIYKLQNDNIILKKYNKNLFITSLISHVMAICMMAFIFYINNS